MFNLSTSSLEKEGIITALFVEWKDIVRCALFHTCFISDEDEEPVSSLRDTAASGLHVSK